MIQTASEVVKLLDEYIARYGDLPVNVKLQTVRKTAKGSRLTTVIADVESVGWGANGNEPGQITITAGKG